MNYRKIKKSLEEEILKRFALNSRRKAEFGIFWVNSSPTF